MRQSKRWQGSGAWLSAKTWWPNFWILLEFDRAKASLLDICGTRCPYLQSLQRELSVLHLLRTSTCTAIWPACASEYFDTILRVRQSLSVRIDSPMRSNGITFARPVHKHSLYPQLLALSPKDWDHHWHHSVCLRVKSPGMCSPCWCCNAMK